MVASALTPLYRAGLVKDVDELRAAAIVIKAMQFNISSGSKVRNADLHKFASFYQYNWPTEPRFIPVYPDQKVLKLRDQFRIDSVAPATGEESPLIAAIRFAETEANARWSEDGAASRLGEKCRPIGWVLGPICKNPPNLLHWVRAAHVLLREGRYPPPFARVSWRVDNNRLCWSTEYDEGAIETYHALSTTNVDLPEHYHAIARHHHQHARFAYRIVELAHDVRGYASEQFPWLARSPFPGSDIATHVGTTYDDWLLVVALCELSAVVEEWRALIEHERNQKRLERGRLNGLHEIARRNEQRSEQAQNWKAIAGALAERLRRSDPHRPLRDIATEVAEKLESQGLIEPPKPETVNRYLRDERPELRRQKRGS